MGEPTRLTTREVLIAARDLIADESKWGKRWPKLGENYNCAVSALEAVDGRLCSDAWAVLAKVIPDSADGIGRWNDAPERTHAEVLAAFDKAIAECDA